MITYQEQLTANQITPASAFEMTYTPIPNTLMVFANGVHQRTNIDFAFANNTIIFTSVLPITYDVRSIYQYDPDASTDLGSTIQIQEVLDENLTTPASSFELTQTPDANSQFIFINGIVQRYDVDYSLSGNILLTTSLIPSSYNVYADYYYTFPSTDYLPITPVGIRASTTLNPVVTSYDLLSERIKMQLGWPMTNIEICEDQIMDFINQACEWFSKYSGFTEEFLVFDSCQYQCGYGIKIDDILNRITDFYCPYSSAGNMVSGQYIDADLNNYRKVAGIFSCDPAGGSGSGSETLFNMDYLFAQQAYFGQMLGGMGYDVVTWHLLKEWMDLRKKMFATDIYVNFNPQTQVVRLTPEPHVRNGRYIGVIGCRMEKSVRELVQERWVQKYALALTKIALGHIRGKFGSVVLFGGGTVNATDIMVQGIEEKNKLEEEIMQGGAEAEPPMFFCQ